MSPRRVASRLVGTANRAVLGLRRLSAPWRSLPHFIVVGAQKAGTTSFFHYLSQHPAVAPAYRKEVHYFDLNYARGDAWYRSFFPRTAKLKGRVTGEASPYYLFHPVVARRMHRTIPGARVFILLRDPAVRALSHYEHSRRLGNERLSLAAALAAEEGRLRGEAAKLEAADGLSLAHQQFSYRSRGDYLPQVKRFHELFGREATQIIVSEEMFADPQGVVRSAFAHLEIDPSFEPPDLGAKAVSPTRAAASQEHDEALARLRADLAPANAALAAYLGRPLPWPSE